MVWLSLFAVAAASPRALRCGEALEQLRHSHPDLLERAGTIAAPDGQGLVGRGMGCTFEEDLDEEVTTWLQRGCSVKQQLLSPGGTRLAFYRECDGVLPATEFGVFDRSRGRVRWISGDQLWGFWGNGGEQLQWHGDDILALIRPRLHHHDPGVTVVALHAVSLHPLEVRGSLGDRSLSGQGPVQPLSQGPGGAVSMVRTWSVARGPTPQSVEDIFSRLPTRGPATTARPPCLVYLRWDTTRWTAPRLEAWRAGCAGVPDWQQLDPAPDDAPTHPQPGGGPSRDHVPSVPGPHGIRPTE